MVKLQIQGMSCSHCVASVKKALSDVEGVRSVIVDLGGGTATVEGDAETSVLVAAVKEEGYQAVPAGAA